MKRYRFTKLLPRIDAKTLSRAHRKDLHRLAKFAGCLPPCTCRLCLVMSLTRNLP